MFKFKDGIFEPKTYEKIIKNTFFGGAEQEASRAQVAGSERAIAAQQAATQQARGDITRLFPAAEQNLLTGFQGALDIFGQSLPAQTQAFQQGIGGAQQALLSGLPQFQNAILGGQIDFSALQPQQFQQPDLSFFQQQLPQFTTSTEALNLRQAVPQNQAFTGPIQNNQIPGRSNPIRLR